MKTKILFFNVLLLLLIPAMVVNAKVKLPTIYPTKYSIITYGATTSSIDNASAINAAITAASSKGGTVVIPAGTFLSGPITMKSNVNLYLSAGAVLQILPYGTGNGTGAAGSSYYPNSGTADQYNPFIFGKGLNNIAVTGTGTIEGNGSAWWAAFNTGITNMKRPCLVRFAACNYVLIDSITLKNSPGVHLTLGQSSSMGSNGTISNVNISAPSNSPNTDAIDTWYWKGIDIKNCNLSEGDDNVAMDSYSQGVTIKNCNLGFGHGISVGSYTTGVDSVNVDSCTFNYTTNGIRLKSQDDRGGVDSVFNYSNITMNAVTNPFYITSYYSQEPSSPSYTPIITGTIPPSFRKVRFKNITVTGSSNAGHIFGYIGFPDQDITFENVQISAASAFNIYFAKNVVFNCSNITVPKGNALSTYSATVSGVDSVKGTSTNCVRPSITLTSGSVLESAKQDSSLTNIVYTYGGSATGASVSTLPAGVSASINTTAQTVTISGSPSVIGIYPYKVTAYSANDTSTISAEIICSTDTAKKVAYVTIPSSTADNLILNKLISNNNFAVTVENAGSSSLSLSGYDLVVISPVPATTAAAMSGLKTLAKPRLLLKPFSLKSGIWSWSSSTKGAVNLNDSTVTIVKKTHQIFNGLTFTGTNNNELQLFRTVYTNGVTGITSSTWVTAPTVLGNASTSATTNSIVEIPVGTTMNGTLVSKRFIMIGLSEASTINLTPTATQLIENACLYLLGDSVPSSIQMATAAGGFTVIQNGNTIRVSSSETVTGLQFIGITGITYAKAAGNELTEQLQPGVYILKISYGNNQTYYKKVFIK
ncbi:MAG: glycosyl hydrolase family 28 protein [Paludibacteraceae bacterium]|nr:glycosyl hydrolase family 28 protein [Paludibacteraceae bacterium]